MIFYHICYTNAISVLQTFVFCADKFVTFLYTCLLYASHMLHVTMLHVTLHVTMLLVTMHVTMLLVTMHVTMLEMFGVKLVTPQLFHLCDLTMFAISFECRKDLV